MKSHFFVNRKAVCNKLVWNIYSVIEWNLYTSKTHSDMLQELPMIHKEEYIRITYKLHHVIAKAYLCSTMLAGD